MAKILGSLVANYYRMQFGPVGSNVIKETTVVGNYVLLIPN